jgi:hypothetical protein
MEKEKEGFPITSLREINTILKAQHPNIVTVRVRLALLACAPSAPVCPASVGAQHPLKGQVRGLHDILGSASQGVLVVLRCSQHAYLRFQVFKNQYFLGWGWR